jgi:Response regulators consisting of a CheY-like receiver domain and a winged-helix DNA-binding domain
MIKILVVEDDKELRRLFCTVLSKQNFHTLEAENGEKALDILDRETVALVVTDVMMPKMDGYKLVDLIRGYDKKIPILMITAKGAIDDKQKGFRSGIDDYMVKPIDVNEMVLRIEALLRRAEIINDKKVIVGDTTLKYDELTVADANGEILLPKKEFYLLYKLISYPDKIFTRQHLMDTIWGINVDSETRTVDVHINRLRDRFKANRDFEIVTVRGLGYKAVKKYE